MLALAWSFTWQVGEPEGQSGDPWVSSGPAGCGGSSDSFGGREGALSSPREAGVECELESQARGSEQCLLSS